MHFEFGKSILLVPFGVLLFFQSFAAARLGNHLTSIAVAFVTPAVQVARVSADFDPFATERLPTTAWVDPEADLDENTEVERVEGLLAPNGSTATNKTKSKSKAPGSKASLTKSKTLPSVRVSKAVVLRLAQSAQRPTGNPVAASGNRPAGIQVFGASSLGIGVRDGDVLTHVSGVAITQIGQVFALVIAARGARKTEIVGRLWRGNRSYVIVVEQPYLNEIENSPKRQEPPTDVAPPRVTR